LTLGPSRPRAPFRCGQIADRRIGDPGPALLATGNRSQGPQPDGRRESKNLATYQGLDALTK